MSADSIEIRLVKVESDIRRIDATSEPRFERIEKALAKLTEIAERHSEQIVALQRSLAIMMAITPTKDDLAATNATIGKLEVALLREINAMTTRFIRWIAFVAGVAVAALKYLP